MRDESRGKTSYNRIAWPAQNMPLEFWHDSDAWHVTFGSYETINDVVVTLTRKGDGRKWTFSEDNADGYFKFRTAGYFGGYVIFRPDSISYSSGDAFDVTISGADGTTVAYTVNFFSICDGNHSTWAALNTFFTNKGPDYGVMITDSLQVKGLPAGTRTLFGGNLIELYEDGSAHLVGAGNLAGSTLKVNQGLRNLVEMAGLPWQTAINSCTINPARLIGMEASKGSVTAGKDADIVVLGDDYSVEDVYVCGQRQE